MIMRLTCCIRITALHVFECTTAVDDEIFCPSAEMHQVQGAEEQGLHNKVPVTDCIHGVWADSSIEA